MMVNRLQSNGQAGDAEGAIEEALAVLLQLAAVGGEVPPGPAEDQHRRTNGATEPSPQPGSLRFREVQYRVLIEQIPAVTFLASLSGGTNEMYVSPQIESLLGFTQEEWITDPVLWYHLIHPDDREWLSRDFATACITGQPFQGVVRVYTRDGVMRWVQAEARFVRDDQGRLLFLQGTGFDVTEQFRAQEAREALIREQAARVEAEHARAQIEQALQQRDEALAQLRDTLRLREEFLAAAAHDLKTPIAAIKGRAQLMRRRLAQPKPPETEQLMDGVVAIDRTAARMAAMVEEFLDLARLQSGQDLLLDRRPIDLVKLLQQTIADEQAQSERHTIYFEASSSELWGIWDPVRLARVFSNLLDNAMKYSPHGGDIHVRVLHDARTTGTIQVQVQDHGIGISAADLPRIFEQFYRGSNVQGRIAGTGIGLSGSYYIVQQHGGSIYVESNEGAGSTFTVRLPVEE